MVDRPPPFADGAAPVLICRILAVQDAELHGAEQGPQEAARWFAVFIRDLATSEMRLLLHIMNAPNA